MKKKRKKIVMRVQSQRDGFHRNERLDKIKKVADSVDITGMTKREAEAERMYAVIGARISQTEDDNDT